MCDAYNKEAILPGEHFAVMVEFRLKRGHQGLHADWRSASETLTISTLEMDPEERAVLLEGRFPRVHLANPIRFARKSDRIKHGLKTLP